MVKVPFAKPPAGDQSISKVIKASGVFHVVRMVLSSKATKQQPKKMTKNVFDHFLKANWPKKVLVCLIFVCPLWKLCCWQVCRSWPWSNYNANYYPYHWIVLENSLLMEKVLIHWKVKLAMEFSQNPCGAMLNIRHGYIVCIIFSIVYNVDKKIVNNVIFDIVNFQNKILLSHEKAQ